MGKASQHQHDADFAQEHSRLRLLYFCLLVFCLASLIIVNAFIINNSLDKSRSQFDHQARANFQHIHAVIHNNSSILDGFSAFLEGVGFNIPSALNRYTQKVLARHPDIYQIQAAKYVAANEFNQLSMNSRDTKKKITIKSFTTNQGVSAVTEPTKAAYYPIIFIAPNTQNLDIKGLDLLTIPFINEAIHLAKRNSTTALSSPFETFEGEQAFVMIQPSYYSRLDIPDIYGLLVIKAKTLLNTNLAKVMDISLSITSPQAHNAKSIQPYLHTEQAHQSDDWLQRFMPRLTFKENIHLGNQKVTINMSHQTHWRNLPIWIMLWITVPFLSLTVAIYIMYLIHRNAEEAKHKTSKELYQMANFDALTGLSNRCHFLACCLNTLENCKRRNGKLALLYLDLDHFKEINDSIGHQAGDKALQHMAQAISDGTRTGDLSSRLGGDEFVVLLENIQELHEVERITSRIRQNLKNNTDTSEQFPELEASIGVAYFPLDSHDLEHLLVIADQRMYQDKNFRKNQSRSSHITSLH